MLTFNSPNSPRDIRNRDTVEDGFGDLIAASVGPVPFLTELT